MFYFFLESLPLRTRYCKAKKKRDPRSNGTSQYLISTPSQLINTYSMPWNPTGAHPNASRGPLPHNCWKFGPEFQEDTLVSGRGLVCGRWWGLALWQLGWLATDLERPATRVLKRERVGEQSSLQNTDENKMKPLQKETQSVAEKGGCPCGWLMVDISTGSCLVSRADWQGSVGGIPLSVQAAVTRTCVQTQMCFCLVVQVSQRFDLRLLEARVVAEDVDFCVCWMWDVSKKSRHFLYDLNICGNKVALGMVWGTMELALAISECE